LLAGTVGVAGSGFSTNAAITIVAVIARVGPGLDILTLPIGLVG